MSSDFFDWLNWLLLAGSIALVLRRIFILDKQLPAAYEASQNDEYAARLRQTDRLSVLALVLAIAAAWFLPAFQLTDPGLPIGAAVTGSLLSIALTLFPPIYSSPVGLRWGAMVLMLLKIFSTIAAFIGILSLPPQFVNERNWILVNLVFCGGLTLYREIRRRWRSGDRSWASRMGGFLVVIQFLSLISLAAMALTMALIVALMLIGLLEDLDPIGAWLKTVVFLLSTTSVIYLFVYSTRHLMGARGFSWLDPPNWRVALPHLQYLLGLKPSFPFIGLESTLADQIRKTYITAITGTDPAAITAAARIAPLIPGHTPTTVTFAVVGDPGEADDSGLYPGTKRGASKQVAGQMLQSGSTNSATPDHRDDQVLDFVIISSDVVYPAGELMDYEQAIYRPYSSVGRPADVSASTQASVPIYAIPGNHDWYDTLRGFMANFTYAAANTGSPPRQSALRDMPWEWRPWRQRIWEEIRWLREAYQLETLGGLPELKATQQQLSFFELDLGDVPLSVLALDNGVTGAVDDLQYAWLEQRLKAIRAPGSDPGQIILVLVGNPLYANGVFSGEPTPSRDARPGKSYGIRALYELFREYRVDVVMGGDTHAYERYEATYTDSRGMRRTMHHIVNGGGGAYLTWPLDAGWVDFAWSPTTKLKLNQRGVYQAYARERASDTGGPDEVILHDLFPTTKDIIDKFVWGVEEEPHGGRLARWRTRFQRNYNQFLLDRGLTNALDHDRQPLLQSYVTVEMVHIARGRWELRIVPWFSAPDSPQAEPQRHRQLVLQSISGKDPTRSGSGKSVIAEALANI